MGGDRRSVNVRHSKQITHKNPGVRVSCLCPRGVLTDMLKNDDLVTLWVDDSTRSFLLERRLTPSRRRRHRHSYPAPPAGR